MEIRKYKSKDIYLLIERKPDDHSRVHSMFCYFDPATNDLKKVTEAEQTCYPITDKKKTPAYYSAHYLRDSLGEMPDEIRTRDFRGKIKKIDILKSWLAQEIVLKETKKTRGARS